MDKAILVIDMPESCEKCPLFHGFYTDMTCGANNYSINYPYPKDFRQDWCPLKPAPEEQTKPAGKYLPAGIKNHFFNKTPFRINLQLYAS